MNAAIAQHLNVTESAIIEIQEWVHVLWVRVKGLGARFVSKKVTKVENAHIDGFKQFLSEKRQKLASAATEKKAARLSRVVERMERELAWMTQLPASVFDKLGAATTAASLVDDLLVATRKHELSSGENLPRP